MERKRALIDKGGIKFRVKREWSDLHFYIFDLDDLRFRQANDMAKKTFGLGLNKAAVRGEALLLGLTLEQFEFLWDHYRCNEKLKIYLEKMKNQMQKEDFFGDF
ncbi:MAG: hypothetical protein EBU08_03750 [Micrococcales bacterium]|nr:hypothetical protein [Micrococcales bacterium]